MREDGKTTHKTMLEILEDDYIGDKLGLALSKMKLRDAAGYKLNWQC